LQRDRNRDVGRHPHPKWRFCAPLCRIPPHWGECKLMAASRIPVDVDARMGPRALEDLASALTELGYEPRSTAAEVGGVGSAEGRPELHIKVGERLTPDA